MLIIQCKKTFLRFRERAKVNEGGNFKNYPCESIDVNKMEVPMFAFLHKKQLNILVYDIVGKTHPRNLCYLIPIHLLFSPVIFLDLV